MNKITFTILALICLLLASCSQEENICPNNGTGNDNKEIISLSLVIPGAPIHTQSRAGTTVIGSDAENLITSLYVTITINGTDYSKSYTGSDLGIFGTDASGNPTIEIKYPVDASLLDGITTIATKVRANYSTAPSPITGEDAFWTGAVPVLQPLFMSGAGNVTKQSDDTFAGSIGLDRQVAKLRTRVSKAADCIPLELQIKNSEVTIEVLNVADQSTEFKPSSVPSITGLKYIDYAARTGSRLRTSTVNGVTQVDSCYIHENISNSYTDDNTTTLRITVPTLDPLTKREEDIVGVYKIRGTDSYKILRNHIYTIDIKVRSQSVPMNITMSLKAWDIKEEEHSGLEPVLSENK